MSIVSRQSLIGLGCVCHWPGQYAESGVYDDDGNKRGFNILPDGVTVTSTETFAVQKMKDGRNVLVFNGTSNYVSVGDHESWNFGSGDYTICGWVNIQSTTAGIQLIFQYQSGYKQHYFSVSKSLNQLVYCYADGVGYPIDITLNYTFDSGWHFCALIRNKTTGQITLKVNNSATTVSNNIDVPNISGPLLINGYITSGGNFLYGGSGNIKDLMIFKGRSLSVDQLSAIMSETYIY